MSDQFDFSSSDGTAPVNSRYSREERSWMPLVMVSLFSIFTFLLIAGSIGAVAFYYYRDANAKQETREKKLKDELDAAKVAAERERNNREWRIEDDQRQQRERLEKQKWQQFHEEVQQQQVAKRADAEDAEREKKRQADERARRIGSMSGGKFREANRVLELIKAGRIEAVSQFPPETVENAAVIDPVAVEQARKRLAERRMLNIKKWRL